VRDIIFSNERRPGDDYVFPANYNGRGGRKQEDTVTQINRRIKNAKLDPLEHWTLHDLRRTFRTRLGKLCEDKIAELLLGHVTHRPKLKRTYDVNEYMDEMREALLKWEAKLRVILYGPKDPENVVYPEFGERRQSS
jgi:integrase